MKKVQRSAPVFFRDQSFNVDASNGVIRDIVIIQSGQDKYGENWDSKSLQQIVEQGNAQGQGVKSRFGHPNMCDTTLGSFLGRYKNFRLGVNKDGKQVVLGDLQLDKDVATKSPKGNLYDYTIGMAQNNSDMFGNSIVYMPDDPEAFNEKDDSGNNIVVYYQRVKSFLASDLVDSPAATDSLFKDTEDFAALATNFLEENPGIYEVISKHPQVLKEFLSKYESFNKQKNQMAEEKSFLEKFKEIIGVAKPAVKETVTTDDGKTINVDGGIAVGSTVTDDQGNATPDATYKLADGRTIKTDSNSKIVEVIPAANQSNEQKEILALREENKNLKDQINALEEEWEKEREAVLEEVAKMKEEITGLKSKIESRHKVNTGETRLREQRGNEPSRTERNLAEESKARREACEKKKAA